MKFKFNLFGFNTDTFEQFARSLALEILGKGVTTYGNGPDGGREATFEGHVPFPYPPTDTWSGYGVIQAKCKEKPEGTKIDQGWAFRELRGELDRFKNRRAKKPEYYIFVTNVELSSPEGGAKDQVENLLKEISPSLGLKGFKVWDANQIFGFLPSFPALREAFKSELCYGGGDASLDVSFLPFAAVQDHRHVHYEATQRTGEKVVIEPKCPYFEDYDRGTIRNLYYGSGAFKWQFPSLDLKVCNNTSETMFLERVIVNVESSRPVARPLLTFNRSRNIRCVEIRNHGWAEPRNCRVSYFLHEDVPDSAAVHSKPFELAIPVIKDVYDWNLEENLRLLGVNLDMLSDPRSRFASNFFDHFGPFKRGKFGTGTAKIVGTIEYEWAEIDGRLSGNCVQFETFLELSGQACSGPVSATEIPGVNLEVGKQNYDVESQVSWKLDAEDVHRMELPLIVAATSVHEIRVRVSYNGGKLLEYAPITMEIFVPNGLGTTKGLGGGYVFES